jgi:hypothetical protein
MDTLLLLELTDNLNEALNQLSEAQVSDDALAMLDASDAVNDALIALDGEGVPVEQPKDFTLLLNSIINGDVSAFDDSTKLTELVDAAKESGGDDMPEDKKGLFIEAIKAAGVQVLEGQGFELVD